MRLLLGFLLVFASGCNCSGVDAYAFSNFDGNDEDWTIDGNGSATPMRPELTAIGGNPGGHICGTDMSMSVWYFVAPQKYLGNASKAFGRRLTWDLKQDTIYQQVKGRDVILQGNGLAVVFNIAATPKEEWTPYQARLDGASGWKIDQEPDFPVATDDQMRTLLRNVTSLHVRGEFVDGPDHECLDNVYFGVE